MTQPYPAATPAEAVTARTEPVSAVPPAVGLAVADPAPLGLAAFALTTFLLSAANAGWAPHAGDDIAWLGPALFYGGLAQLLAGMWEFRNRNVFGATAFSTYGAFWLSLYVVAAIWAPHVRIATDVLDNLGWFLLGFAIFNTYMLMWSSRVSVAVFAVFLTLEITEIILFIGFFSHPKGTGFNLINLGGIIGIVTALTAWYASAAAVLNGMAGRPVLPTGAPFWK
jgi:succinate-acetate transporter protein